jgi:hypothetical protein
MEIAVMEIAVAHERPPTRNERALDRLIRHSDFVRARMERAIHDAPDEHECLRRISRRIGYSRLVLIERVRLRDKIAAHQRHLQELEYMRLAGLPPRRSWRKGRRRLGQGAVS